MLRNIVATALSIAFCTTLSSAAAIQKERMVSPDGLWEVEPNGKGITVWVSNVTDTVFGEDATDFDYYLGGDHEDPGNMKHFDGPIGSIEHFAKVWKNGDPYTQLVAMENVSMMGSLTAEQAADKAWLCQDMDCPMNQVAEACKGFKLECSEWVRIEL